MAKINRNEPCPCGSGKKYKKCCLHNNEASPLSFTEEDRKTFQKLLPSLFDYSKKFDDKLQPLYQRYTASFEDIREQDAKAFSQIIFHWLIFNAPVLNNSETILSSFIEENRETSSPALQKLLDRWKGIKPSLLIVTKEDNNTIQLKDSLDPAAIIPEKTAALADLSDGDLLIGYIYPTPDGSVLGTDALLVPASMKSAFYQEYDRLTDSFNRNGKPEKEFFVDCFPAFISLISWFLSPENDNKADAEAEEKQAEVINVLFNQIDLMAYPYSLLLRAEKMWNSYYGEKNPRIQKPAVFAASLEYWMSKQPGQWTNPKQKELAEKYGVSPATISAKYKDFTSSLTEEPPVRVPRG
jgi:hypothetical protein